MKRKILSLIMNFSIGIFLLYVGLKNLWLGPFINQEEQIMIGFCLVVFSLVLFFLQIFKIKNKGALYAGIIMGILLVMMGFYLMWRSYSFSATIMVVGIILFVPNFIELLRKKFPGQDFFNIKKEINK